MTEAQFPLRPDHPDFWALSEVILDFDHAAAADPEGAFEKVVADADIDMASAVYMGMQRSMRLLGADTREKVAELSDVLMKMTTLYVEAVVVGIHFKHRRNAT